MATVRMLYWKEIPTQVQAEDESGKVSHPLDARFQQGVDVVAMVDGSSGTDAYLEAWEWGKAEYVEGTAAEAAEIVADSYNSGFPADFVTRIRELHQSGVRDVTPGSIDDWIEGAAH